MNATEEIDSDNEIGQILREEKTISKGYFSATPYNCWRLKPGSHTLSMYSANFSLMRGRISYLLLRANVVTSD